MKPIDKMRTWLLKNELGRSAETLVIWSADTFGPNYSGVTYQDLRTLVAEHDRLVEELAQAKLIGAAEGYALAAGYCRDIIAGLDGITPHAAPFVASLNRIALTFDTQATELRERAAKEAGGG